MTEPWLATTAPLWTLVGLCYGLAGIYLSAFDDCEYQARMWLPFLIVGAAIILLANRSHFLRQPHTGYVEYAALLSIFASGIVMFAAIRHYAHELERHREILEQLDDDSTE